MTTSKINAEQPRVRMDADGLRNDLEWHLRYTLAASPDELSDLERYQAFSFAIRDRIVERWINTQDEYRRANTRQVYYLSLEFLIGRLLTTYVQNLQLEKETHSVLDDKEISWEKIRNVETDAGLGNGGLGRLAACFMDSMATMKLPCMGYGLRYDYGIFKQKIVNGAQIEEPDNWRRNGYSWEIKRPKLSVHVQFGGQAVIVDVNGQKHWRWSPNERVIGMPFDLPVVAYGGKHVNTVRLWSAQADNEFSLEDFNRGSYMEAVGSKVLAENLTKVLYPNDDSNQGKELRLRQQYFFVACTLRDILRNFRANNDDWRLLPDKVFIQLNDTHPTLVIPELMRILLDEEALPWEDAWRLVCECVGYTNHTVLPEALERWSLPLFANLLPRHMQIVYEINSRFLRVVSSHYPGDINRLRRMSVIEEGPEQRVRMANLALIGAKKVNGVARIHSDILKNDIFRDFSELWPEKFTNVTNGITPRRWLLKANPGLAALISANIGDGWIRDLYELRNLRPLAEDSGFLDEFYRIKQQNKLALAKVIKDSLNLAVDPESIFDVQVKRMHEYKRQLLLSLYIIMLYNRLVENPNLDIHPRTFIFSGKSAPGYATAKLVIRLIHGVSELINNHPSIRKKLTVVFLPDYRVSLAESIIPAANLSEQISLAGTEASGTGNMKLMLNGALTIGTMDGANVEIHEEVGDDNMFIFGMRAPEVPKIRRSYSPLDVYNQDLEIQQVLENIRKNVFSILTPGVFDPLLRNLLDQGDYYMHLADLRDYADTQDRVDALYRQRREWDRRAVINVACAGKFSSDRAIAEYARTIWNLQPFSYPEDLA
jgi:starch phosphorylase